jgi:hypothetical protein
MNKMFSTIKNLVSKAENILQIFSILSDDKGMNNLPKPALKILIGDTDDGRNKKSCFLPCYWLKWFFNS